MSSTTMGEQWAYGSGESLSARVLKGCAAGLVGGFVASWVMNQFFSLSSQLTAMVSEPGQKPQTGRPGAGGRREVGTEQPVEEPEPATVKAASAVSTRVLHHELTEQEKRIAGPAVHFGYGTLMGGLYGGLAEVAPIVSAGAGTAYGTAVWLGGDLIALPLLHLSKPPAKVPLSEHSGALAAHFVYGCTLDLTRRAILRAF